MKIIATKFSLLIAMSLSLIGTASAQWVQVGPASGPGFDVYTLKSKGTAELYAGGASQNNKGISKWDGTSWTSLGKVTPELNQSPFGINCMVVWNSELYVGGDIDSVAGVNAHPGLGVCKWDGTNWVALGTTAPSIGGADCMAIYNGALYAGGQNGVAKWDGTSWTSVGTTDGVSALVVMGTDLYAAGSFSHIGAMNMANGAKGFAKYDGTNWTALPGFYDTIAQLPGVNVANAASMILFNNDLCVIGALEWSGNVRTRGIARWDGTAWHDMNGGLTGNGQLSQDCMTVDDNHLYVTGPIQKVNTTDDSVYLSAMWDGSTWHPMFGGNAAYTSFYAAENFNGNIYSAYTGLAKWTGAAAVAKAPLAIPRVQVYPNPSTGLLNIALPGAMPAEIKVMDMSGAVIYEETLKAQTNMHSINLADATAGMYFVIVKQGDNVQVKKVSIEK
ncbi:MAG: T9SS type A sorting domain-containing protein [Bacteroidetes bacterium]|nr:T9SS type A sorting domain-containing protein [Bacteroidota bacterium]